MKTRKLNLLLGLKKTNEKQGALSSMKYILEKIKFLEEQSKKEIEEERQTLKNKTQDYINSYCNVKFGDKIKIKYPNGETFQYGVVVKIDVNHNGVFDVKILGQDGREYRSNDDNCEKVKELEAL